MDDTFKFIDDIRVRYAEGLINRTEALASIHKSVSAELINHSLDLSRKIDRENTTEMKLDRIVKIIEE